MQFFMMVHKLSLLLGFGGILVRLVETVGLTDLKKLGLASMGT